MPAPIPGASKKDKKGIPAAPDGAHLMNSRTDRETYRFEDFRGFVSDGSDSVGWISDDFSCSSDIVKFGETIGFPQFYTGKKQIPDFALEAVAWERRT